MSATFVLIIILLISIGIFLTLICDNKSLEIEKFLNQLKLLTTSNLIVWTKHEQNSYNCKIIVYEATTKIGVFFIKINQKHEDELRLPTFDQIYIGAVPFTQPFEINISKMTSITLIEKYRHLRQLIEIQLKHTVDGEITHE